jgi:phosphate starvation-inducible PhoH-like protein
MRFLFVFFIIGLLFSQALKPLYLPKNTNQELYQSLLRDPKCPIIIAEGPAGTGKTSLAVQHALLDFSNYKKLVLTRPIVSSDSGIGFLRGDLNQKMDPWVAPLFDVLREFYPSSKIKQWVKEGIIEIAPFSFLRGRTFKNSFIIADEIQNATPAQTKLLLTRIGEGSKMVLTGDTKQTDLRRSKDGLSDLISRIEKTSPQKTNEIGLVRLQSTDTQRHPILFKVLELYQ